MKAAWSQSSEGCRGHTVGSVADKTVRRGVGALVMLTTSVPMLVF